MTKPKAKDWRIGKLGLGPKHPNSCGYPEGSVWTDGKRFLRVHEILENYWGSPVLVGFATKRIGESRYEDWTQISFPTLAKMKLQRRR